VKHFSAWWRLHGNVLFGLCLVTMMLWQWRFVRTGPNLLEENACESLTNWIAGETINPAYAKADAEGLVLTKQKNQPNFSLFKNLDGIDDVRFLAVTVDAAWENAQPHPVIHWLQPRVVIAGYDAGNSFSAPLDHGVVNARGTRGWHRVQGVVELPPELAKARLSIDGFGVEGVLRLRNMRVEVVKQRVWFIPATIILLGLWAFALGRMLRPHIHGRGVSVRAFLIACGIIFGTWHFVFPQGRTLFLPLIGQFSMGPVIRAEIEPESPPPPPEEIAEAIVEPPSTKPAPRLRTIVPTDPNATKKTTPEPQVTELKKVPIPVTPTATPEKRHGMQLGQTLRGWDRKWNFNKYNLTHITAFFGIGLFVFGLAGSWRIWPLPCIVAVLGEIVPNALFNTWDRGDWWDLLANFSGLALALGIVVLVQRIRKKRRDRQGDTQGYPPASVV
jgi:hypothetical protein